MTGHTAAGEAWKSGHDLTIVVPIHGQLDVTRKFLESMERQTVDCLLIFADDASPDDSVEWLARNGYTVLTFSERLWFNGIVNLAMQSCRTKYLGILNNDLILGRRFVEDTIHAFERSGYDVLVPRTLSPDLSLDLDGPGEFRIVPLYRREGWCMLFRTASLRNIPPIPAKELRLWYGDNWIFHHAWKARLEVGAMLHVPIRHECSATIHAATPGAGGIHPVVAEDIKIFREKYSWVDKGRPGLYRFLPRSIRRRILPYY